MRRRRKKEKEKKKEERRRRKRKRDRECSKILLECVVRWWGCGWIGVK